MDPTLVFRYVAALYAVVFRFWIRLLGAKVFWGLFALSSMVATVLIIRDSV